MTGPQMTGAADAVAALFTGADGVYRFARWQRPVVPVVFGTDDRTLGIVKGAFEAVVALAGHRMADTDPELGVNVMVFFLRDWSELRDVPDLDRLIDGLGPLVDRLQAAGATQYRAFRFEANGAIRAAFVFVRMTGDMARVPAEAIALAQAVQVILLWSDRAFADRSPLAETGGHMILRPEIGQVIRAAYDPVMPVAAGDPSHALRLAARMGTGIPEQRQIP